MSGIDSEPVAMPVCLNAADFSHWARASRWEGMEFIALALGCEPIDTSSLNELHRRARSGAETEKAFVQRLERMHRLVERQFDDLRYFFRKPSDLLQWMRERKLWIPDGMAEAIDEFDQSAIDWRARAKTAEHTVASLTSRVSELEAAIADGVINTSSQTRERESLLKLVIGVAVEQYNFDPRANRNTAAAEIASDLQLCGLSLTDDTIRKYLREGAELLPPPEAE